MPPFVPSAIVTGAPKIPLAVALSVPVPLKENAVAVGVGVGDDGEVVVLLPPHADAAMTSRTTVTRVNITSLTVVPSKCLTRMMAGGRIPGHFDIRHHLR